MQDDELRRQNEELRSRPSIGELDGEGGNYVHAQDSWRVPPSFIALRSFSYLFILAERIEAMEPEIEEFLGQRSIAYRLLINYLLVT